MYEYPFGVLMVKVIMVIKQTKAFEIYSEHAKTKKNKLSGKKYSQNIKGNAYDKKKSFNCSNQSAMIEFEECPEFPFWFAQTKFSL